MTPPKNGNLIDRGTIMSEPITRVEKYIAYAAGEWNGVIPTPITRIEQYLYELCINGGGGGGGDVSGVKGANETEYRKGNVNIALNDIVKIGDGLTYNSTANELDADDLSEEQMNDMLNLLG